MFVWPKITDKIPGSLIAIIVTTAIVYFAKLPVNTIGSVYGQLNSAFPAFHVPAISMKLVQQMLSPAFTIAVLAAIESLLSAVVSDGMIGDTHKSNAELIGQGLGNIFPACSVEFLQRVPLQELLQTCAMVAALLVVAANMADWSSFLRLCKSAPKATLSYLWQPSF